MKPLDKLEQEIFKSLTGHEYIAGKHAHGIYSTIAYEEYSRAAAQVAKDLARRAASYGYHVHLDETRGIRSNGYFTRFLESEGITE